MSEIAQNPADSGHVTPAPCNVCGDRALVEFPEYRAFHRVTSDCRTWAAGGLLFACRTCGCVQKIADATFRRECDAIYHSYVPFYQSKDGAEQAVFDSLSGISSPRSRKVLERLASEFGLGTTGRMLDVGCGNGAMIRGFSHTRPEWFLAGTDLTDRYRALIEAIPRVERLHVGPLGDIPGQFDVVTMSHVLEHVIEPRGFLASLKPKLAPGGLLLAQLPSYRHNPFELMVADHASHFTTDTARELLERCGYVVPTSLEGWVAKEISVVARVSASPIVHPPSASTAPGEVRAFVTERLRWLGQVVDSARAAARGGPIGLFGTSIAATWLFAELGEAVSFFVDEDRNRVGRDWNGRPVLAPADVPAASRVFVGLAPLVAESICRRLGGRGVDYLATPPLPN